MQYFGSPPCIMMKKISVVLGALLLCVTAQAVGYAYNTTLFRPGATKNSEFELDHHYAYTWGISSAASYSEHTYTELKGQLKSGWSIDCVTLTFEDIWDWKIEAYDRLWVNLLDTDYKGNSSKDLKKGVKAIEDNAGDNDNTNYFTNSKNTPLSNWTASNGTSGSGGYWTDPNGGQSGAKKTTVTFTFTLDQMTKLATYINNGGATSGSTGYADFGFAFDPDCHYYNTGIELKVVTKKYYVPEGGASVAFLGTGLLALAAARRFLRR